jgi:hypothetical protein
VTLRRSLRRGFTLVETIVSVGVAGFIFTFIAFLVYMTAINFVNLRDQILSQVSASAASERVVSLLRNAKYFQRFSGDTATTITRVQFIVPTSGGGTATHSIAYDSTHKQLKSYLNATATGTPDRTYKNITDFAIVEESQFRLTLYFYFEYRAFAKRFRNPGLFNKGQFITDVIAKNHFLDEGDSSYADPNEVSVGPARL